MVQRHPAHCATDPAELSPVCAFVAHQLCHAERLRVPEPSAHAHCSALAPRAARRRHANCTDELMPRITAVCARHAAHLLAAAKRKSVRARASSSASLIHPARMRLYWNWGHALQSSQCHGVSTRTCTLAADKWVLAPRCRRRRTFSTDQPRHPGPGLGRAVCGRG